MAKKKKPAVISSDGFADLVDQAAGQISTEIKLLNIQEAKIQTVNSKTGLPSGVLMIDLLLYGGLPNGKFASIHGETGSGKTTFANLMMGAAHAQKRPVLYVDAEQARDNPYLKKFKVKFNNKDLFQYALPVTGEGAFKLIKRVLENWPDDKQPGPLIVLDSFKALTPRVRTEDEDSEKPALHARMASKWLGDIKNSVGLKNAIFLMINQRRLNIMASYGNPIIEPGGEAVLLTPDIRIMSSAIGRGKAPETGFIDCRLRLVKSRHCPPFRMVDARLNIGMGFDPLWDTWQYLLATDQAEVVGGRYAIWWEGKEPAKSYRYSDGAFRELLMQTRVQCRKQLETGEFKGLYEAQYFSDKDIEQAVENED